MSSEPITVATEQDAFADVPELACGLRQGPRGNPATWALNLSDEDFAEWAALEADDFEEYLEDQLFMRWGGA